MIQCIRFDLKFKGVFMKLVKLSLAAALAAGSFSALNAISLEDAIKNVDFSGQLRYRYDTGRWDGSKNNAGISAQGNIGGQQDHKIRARLGAKADIGDGFKVFGQVQYGPDNNGGYGAGSTTATNRTFDLRQAYLQYDLADYATSFTWGKQEFTSIWTDDISSMSARATYTGIEGLTLTAFAVDSFELDSDRPFYDIDDYTNATTTANSVGDFLFRQNFYGAAAIGSYDLGGSSLDTQLWLGYLNKRAFFYALDVVYGLDIDQDLNYALQLSYLGNSVDSALKDKVHSSNLGNMDPESRLGTTANGANETLIANGNLINLMGTLKGYGFDGSLGGVLYGKKGKFTINRLDDSFLAGGREIFYVKGSNIMNSFGQNTFGYVKAGYTLPSDLRLGVQFVYGSTQAGDRNIGNAEYYGGGDKMEAVVEASYNYSKNLNFLLWYSYLDWKSDKGVESANGAYEDAKNTKDTVRFQAIYKF
ncbi:hypothetical protein CQA38_09005 [Campylobacter sp. MIT 12-5580]|nr:hypothetical protein CQA38_09005 [Campylobacter sp. MIT 12-5580]